MGGTESKHRLREERIMKSKKIWGVFILAMIFGLTTGIGSQTVFDAGESGKWKNAGSSSGL
jgi:hypothetical protein